MQTSWLSLNRDFLSECLEQIGMLRFELVKHRYLAVEAGYDFVEQWVGALDDERHVVLPFVIAFHLYSLDEVALLLLIAVEPAQKQPCTLSLLVVGRAANVEHDVGVLAEELLYDADDRLGDLLVAGRLLLLRIGEVEPIGGIVWIGVQFKVHVVLNARVGHEHVLVANAVNVVW